MRPRKSWVLQEDVRKRGPVHFLQGCHATFVKCHGITMTLVIDAMEGFEAHSGA